MDTLVVLISAVGGASLSAIINAIANRRTVGATAQKELATGYGQFTDNLADRLDKRDARYDALETRFDALKDRDDLLTWYTRDLLQHIGQVHQLVAASSNPPLTLPPPPPVPAGLTFP